jgi:hypothetical protein
MAMNAFNPLESTKRLEAAGIARGHAEAIASEINASNDDLVTRDFFKRELDAALDRVTIRLGLIVVGAITLACTVLGTVLSN